jgi:hypothetical protein
MITQPTVDKAWNVLVWEGFHSNPTPAKLRRVLEAVEADVNPGTYTTEQVEQIIRQTWEIGKRLGMQIVREKHEHGYNVDRFVEHVLVHRSEET